MSHWYPQSVIKAPTEFTIKAVNHALEDEEPITRPVLNGTDPNELHEAI